jgi:hypothetical protein
MYIEVPSPPATKTGAFGREIESSQGGSLKSLKKQKIYHLECIISKILILCLLAGHWGLNETFKGTNLDMTLEKQTLRFLCQQKVL